MRGDGACHRRMVCVRHVGSLVPLNVSLIGSIRVGQSNSNLIDAARPRGFPPIARVRALTVKLLQIHSHTRSAQGIRRLEILGRDG